MDFTIPIAGMTASESVGISRGVPNEGGSVVDENLESAGNEASGAQNVHLPLRSANQFPGLEEKSMRELDALLVPMHAMAQVDGFAPSRKSFYRTTGLKESSHKKFFLTYTEFVQRCGYRMSAEKLIKEPKPERIWPRAPRTKKHESVFGERLMGSEMMHAPTNEQGVVMLFGMMAKELGFVIELVRTGYPDCEAKRRGADGKWRRVLIEFEFESGRFDHDPAGCDLIICWKDNAKQNDIEVLELKEEMKKRGLVLEE